MPLLRRVVPGLLLLVSATASADAPAAASPEPPCAALADADAPGPALARCLEVLEASAGDDAAIRGSLEQARLALDRAKELEAAGSLDASARALRIARAALLFADRTLALGQARRVLSAAPR